jgi:hypothetical protein
VVNATATPNPAQAFRKAVEAAANATKEGSSILSPSTIAIIAIIVFLVIGAMIALIIYASLKAGPKRIRVEVYDPVRREKFETGMVEVAPGIFATPDGRYIGFISEYSVPITVRQGRNTKRVIPTIKIGQVLYNYDPIKALYLHLVDTEENVPINKISDLIRFLYRSKKARKFKLAPNVEMVVEYDGTNLADMIADGMGKASEESLIGIAGITGKRKEYEAFVKTLVEMKQKEAMSLSGAIVKVLFALLVVALIGGIVYAALTYATHGGLGGLLPHGGATTTTHPATTTQQTPVVETITRTLPRG